MLISPAPTRQQPSMAAPPLPGHVALRILLVEDHADSRRVLQRLLESFGCVVRAAGTVAEALAIADTQSFDLLVSDIGLPDGSGIDVIRQMSAHQKIKGIALSGLKE